MKTLLDYIEKYVEWIVLGLAVIWVGWVAFSYWVEQPVTVSLQSAGGPPRDVPPEEVDAWTDSTLVPQFREAAKAPSKMASPSLMFLPAFHAELFAPARPSSFYASLSFPTSRSGDYANTQTAPEPAAVAQNISVLPVVVPPRVLGVSDGKSVVLLPQAAVPGAAPVAVVANPQPGIAGGAGPGAPGAAPGAAPVIPTAPTDVVWVTLDTEYLASEQAKAYLDAKIPNFLLKGLSVPVLRVTLEREQLNPDGTWTDPVEVPNCGDFGANPLPPFPKPNDVAAINNYQAYVTDHEPLIVQPPFYALAQAPSGDVWWAWLEGNPNANNVNIAQPLKPVTPPVTPTPPPIRPRPTNPNNNPDNYTPPGVPSPSSGHHSGRGGSGGGGRHAPAPTPNAAQESGPGAGAPPPPAPPPGSQTYGPGHRVDGTNVPPTPPSQGSYVSPFANGNASGANQLQGNQPPPPVYPQPGMPSPNNPPSGTAPGGTVANGPKLASPPGQVLDPLNQLPFEIWAHDIGILGQPTGPQPGCTYRYRITIRLKNPFYGVPQVCQKRDDAKQFDIVGTSDWSQPVVVPRLRYFYVADNGMGDGVKIDLYEWKGGRWTMQSLTKLKPGDAIGDTGATVVDLRNDWRNDSEGKIVLIANADGKLEERTLKGDNNNEIHQDLKQKAFQASVSSAVPAGGY